MWRRTAYSPFRRTQSFGSRAGGSGVGAKGFSIARALGHLNLPATEAEWTAMTKESLRAAYRRQVLEFHPDAVGEGAAATDTFHTVTSAFKFCLQQLAESAPWSADAGLDGSGLAEERMTPETIRRLLEQVGEQVKLDRIRSPWSSSSSGHQQPPQQGQGGAGAGAATAATGSPPSGGGSLLDLLEVSATESEANRCVLEFRKELSILLCGARTIGVYLVPELETRQQFMQQKVVRFSSLIPRFVARVTKEREKLEARNRTLDEAVTPLHRTVGWKQSKVYANQHALAEVGLKPLALMGALILHDTPVKNPPPKTTTASHRQSSDFADANAVACYDNAEGRFDVESRLPPSAKECCPELRCMIPWDAPLTTIVPLLSQWELTSLRRYRAEGSLGHALDTLSAELSLNPPLLAVPNMRINTERVEAIAAMMRDFTIQLVSTEADDPVRQLLPFVAAINEDPDVIRSEEKEATERAKRLLTSADEADIKAALARSVRRLELHYEAFEKCETETAASSSPTKDTPPGAGAVVASAGTHETPSSDADSAAAAEDNGHQSSSSSSGTDGVPPVEREDFTVQRSPSACSLEQVLFDVNVFLRPEMDLAALITAIGAALDEVLRRVEATTAVLPDTIALKSSLVSPTTPSEKPIHCFTRVFRMEAPQEQKFWTHVEAVRRTVYAHEPHIRPWKVVFLDGEEDSNVGWVEDESECDVVSIGPFQLQSQDAFVAWLCSAIDQSTLSKQIHDLCFKFGVHNVTREPLLGLSEFLDFLHRYTTTASRSVVESVHLLAGEDATTAGALPLMVCRAGPIAVVNGVLRVPHWCDLALLIPTLQPSDSPPPRLHG